MKKWTLYHNPRCSKSREALALLEASNVSFQVVEYLKDTPSIEELKHILKVLKVPAKNLVRTKEELYQDLSFDLNSDDVILENLTRHPSLLERPILFNDSVAVIARPPELLLELLKS
ncbi:arsenate reductase [Bdellovibrio bacteriovorus W]|nr:arsenate reductase [Bdellovibrio bacteriovorus W]